MCVYIYIHSYIISSHYFRLILTSPSSKHLRALSSTQIDDLSAYPPLAQLAVADRGSDDASEGGPNLEKLETLEAA